MEAPLSESAASERQIPKRVYWVCGVFQLKS
jgi:hypothetical protein